LGYGAHHIKDFFLNYQETTSNDFVLRNGKAELLATDIADWSISFIQTGVESAIGERLRRVRSYLDDDEVFLANYGDVLTDAPMDRIVDDFLATDAVGSLMAVSPQDSFHVVRYDPDGTMHDLEPVADMSMCINGGYFVLRQGIFDYLGEGEDLVMDACVRAARAGRFRVHPHTGFWAPMDTLKERSVLEEMNRIGDRPWAVWDARHQLSVRRAPEVDVGDVAPLPRAV
ncbi:MAG: glucose-1-phosphate cytidylyltransferase, partial [Actinomycetes bacterium]